MAHFILNNRNATFTFELYASNGDRILLSQGYPIKSNAQFAINSLRKFAPYAHHFIKKSTDTGQYYYEILDDIGEVLAISELFWSESSRDYSIRITRKETTNADLIDQC